MAQRAAHSISTKLSGSDSKASISSARKKDKMSCYRCACVNAGTSFLDLAQWGEDCDDQDDLFEVLDREIEALLLEEDDLDYYLSPADSTGGFRLYEPEPSVEKNLFCHLEITPDDRDLNELVGSLFRETFDGNAPSRRGSSGDDDDTDNNDLQGLVAEEVNDNRRGLDNCARAPNHGESSPKEDIENIDDVSQVDNGHQQNSLPGESIDDTPGVTDDNSRNNDAESFPGETFNDVSACHGENRNAEATFYDSLESSPEEDIEDFPCQIENCRRCLNRESMLEEDIDDSLHQVDNCHSHLHDSSSEEDINEFLRQLDSCRSRLHHYEEPSLPEGLPDEFLCPPRDDDPHFDFDFSSDEEGIIDDFRRFDIVDDSSFEI